MYVKDPVKIIKPKKVVIVTSPSKTYTVKKSKFYRFLSVFLIVLGMGTVGIVAVPLFYYQFILGPNFSKTEFIKPVPVLAAPETSTDLKDNTDYTRASSWFPTAKPQMSITSQVSSYTLSIPDLKIKDATTIIGGEDLSRSLIHYGGTGLPGEYGVGVIFGHSILPVFYDPTSYKAIFSTIHTLKNGAKIIINYDGITYTYEVYDRQIVEPTDVSILNQRFDNSYLALVSCYPPGTYYKRLVVYARLLKPE